MSKLKLLNRASGYQILSKSATKAEILIYSSIGKDYWGDSVSAQKFSDDLDGLDATVNELNIRINSPGGDVFDGITIYNRIKSWKKKSSSNKVYVHVDGLAASIASVIALAGDEVIMGEGALFMVHIPWTFTMGNRLDLDRTIDRLVKVEDQIITIYQKKTGLTRDELRDMMETGNGEGTWLDADQAIEKKFVDKKSEETIPIAASSLKGATWLKTKPNIETHASAARKEAVNLKSKVEGFLKARSK